MGSYLSGLNFNSANAVLGLAALIIANTPADAEEIMIVCRGRVSHISSLDLKFQDQREEIRNYKISEDGSVKYPICILKTEVGAYCYMSEKYPAEQFPEIGRTASVQLNRVTGTVAETFTIVSSAEEMAKKNPVLAARIYSSTVNGEFLFTEKFEGECTKSKGTLF